ncbi:MAG: hypothetical protein WB697_05640 [Stellaceae bacterium]
MLDRDYRHVVSPHLRAAMNRLRDPEAVWEIFRDDATIAEMKRLSTARRPAVVATSTRLLALGDWVRGKDARKTFGKLARSVMETADYVVEMGNVETPYDPLFTKATRYRPRTFKEPENFALTLAIGPALNARLKARAARNRRAPEDEALDILSEVLSKAEKSDEPNLAEAIRRRFAAVGGVDDLEPHPPVPVGPPPSFDR